MPVFGDNFRSPCNGDFGFLLKRAHERMPYERKPLLRGYDGRLMYPPGRRSGKGMEAQVLLSRVVDERPSWSTML